MAEKLQVVLELTAAQYKREAREAASATKEIGSAAQSTSAQATSAFGGLGGAVKAAAASFAGLAIADFARDSIMAASDLEESINAVNVVFGDAAEQIHQFGETSVDAVGLAAVNVNKSATVLGSSLINAGFAADEAAAKTIELTTRAADMASVFNTTVPDALAAVQAALRGETDPIEKYGVTLSAAAAEAEAAALGFKKVDGEFDSQAKAAARLNIILQQTQRVHGDFANTADSTSNTMKRMNERFLETKARVGQALMPAMTAALELAEDLAPVFEDVAIAIAEMVAEVGPLLEGIGFLVDAYSRVKGAGEEWQGSQNDLVGSFGAFISELGILQVITGNYGSALGAAADEAANRFNPALQISVERARFMADATKDDLIPAIQDLGPTLGRSIGMIDRQGRAMSNAAEAAQAQRRALIDLANTQADLLDPLGNVLRLQQELDDAQRTLAEAQADAETPARDLALAIIAVEQAQLRLAAAGAALSPEEIQAFAQILVEDFDMSQREALELLDTLNLLDGWQGSATFTLNVISELEEALGGAISNTEIQLRQHGGPVSARRPYIVGEAGPELFVPGMSGMVLPSGVGGGSRTTNITLQSTGDTRTDLQYASIVASVLTLVESP